MHSKTETRRRLRYAAKLARQAAHVAPNTTAEVGYRIKPQYRKAAPATKRSATMASYPKDDDLRDFLHIDLAATDEDLRQGGAVVHLYLSTTGDGGELQDIVVVWLGNDDAEPQVIDPRFVTY